MYFIKNSIGLQLFHLQNSLFSTLASVK